MGNKKRGRGSNGNRNGNGTHQGTVNTVGEPRKPATVAPLGGPLPDSREMARIVERSSFLQAMVDEALKREKDLARREGEVESARLAMQRTKELLGQKEKALQARLDAIDAELSEEIDQTRQLRWDDAEKEFRTQKDALLESLNEVREAVTEARAEEVQAQAEMARIQAEVAEARRKAEPTVHQELAKFRSELEKALGERRRDVEDDVNKRLSDAADEAEGLVATARAQAREILVGARKEAAETRASAAQDSAVARTEAESAAAALLAKAKEDAASLQRNAEREASAILAEARRDADALREKTDIEIREERARRIAALEERERKVTEREEQSDDREAVLDSRERKVQVKTSENERARRMIQAREEDADLEWSDLEQRRAALDDAETRLGAARVEALELELAEVRERLVEARNQHSAVAAERDRLTEQLAEIGGDATQARLEELERLRSRVARLQSELAESQSRERVEDLEREVEQLRPFRELASVRQLELADLKRSQAGVDQRVAEVRDEAERTARERDRLREHVNSLEAELRQIEQDRDAALRVGRELEALRTQRDWLEMERDRLLRMLEVRRDAASESMKRHYGKLADLDRDDAEDDLRKRYHLPDRDLADPPILSTLVQQVQVAMHYHRESANDSGRRYSLDDIRSYLASMAASRIIVIKGLSGTGKTSLPLYFGRVIGAAVDIVPVQSGWRDRIDLVGTFNAFTEEFRSTRFTETVYAANRSPLDDRVVFVVLDECNLSRVEYYFADFLSELEQPKDIHQVRLLDRPLGTKQPVHLADGRNLKIPPNVWFVLTANEDESTFELADKTFDRSSVIQMDHQAPAAPKGRESELPPLLHEGLRDAFDDACKRDLLAGKLGEWLDRVQKALREELEISLGNRFLPMARRYVGVFVAAGGKKQEAIDRLLETKVLRRVARERDPGRRQAVQEVRQIVATWPLSGDPRRSLDLLDRVSERLA